MARSRSPSFPLIMAILLAGHSASATAQATNESAFRGPYVGAQIGAISSDALITFDGVRDPAGRGRFGFGAFAGYNHTVGNFLIGAEGFLSVAGDTDPFTFDPAVVGFSDLEWDRGPAFGLDARAGYIVTRRILIFGTVGWAATEHGYLVDATPLDEITGKSPSGSFGPFGYGGSIEGAMTRQLHVRLTYRRVSGDDLSTSDFEPLVSNAGLSSFELKPHESQILLGIVLIF